MLSSALKLQLNLTERSVLPELWIVPAIRAWIARYAKPWIGSKRFRYPDGMKRRTVEFDFHSRLKQTI